MTCACSTYGSSVGRIRAGATTPAGSSPGGRLRARLPSPARWLRAKPRPITDYVSLMSHQPSASVVIPTRDRAESLARTLDALRLQQTELGWEVIVVDDGSAPPLREDLLAGLPDPSLLRREGVGPAAARNA